MAPSISKECFPKPSECANCNRKYRQGLTKTAEAGKELKRCAGCHVMTYCDKDCQAEHWAKVHKKHCKFLSGKKEVKGTKHVENSCSLCVQEKETKGRDIASCNSPKTNCHVERVKEYMETMLGGMFKFHREGKTCSCSAQLGWELPFPLGEITEVYLGFGLDEMLAHALKILNAMKIKTGRGNFRLQEKIEDFFIRVAAMRSLVMENILVYGYEASSASNSKLRALINDLETSYGVSSAWLDSLSFTVAVLIQLTNIQATMYYNSRSLEDPRFTNLKLIQEFSQSQLKYCQGENSFMNLKLWPTLSGGSLVILFPEEIHCGNCRALLAGPICVNLYPEENDPRPVLLPYLGELGLVASCPVTGRQDCRINCMKRNAHVRALIEGYGEKIDEETELFINEIRYCDMCLTASLSSHRCSQCYAAQYCSTQCQRQDLAFHMTVCDAWAKDEGRKLNAERNKWRLTPPGCSRHSKMLKSK